MGVAGSSAFLLLANAFCLVCYSLSRDIQLNLTELVEEYRGHGVCMPGVVQVCHRFDPFDHRVPKER
jgi:hypothetical protein